MENKLEFENRLKDYIGNPYIVIFNNTKKAFEVAYEIIKKERKFNYYLSS